MKYVFSRAWEDKQQVNEDIIKLGQRILVFIAKQPERQADKTEIYRDCFKSHVSASKIDAALAYLLNATPPKLEQMEKPRADGQIGAPRMVYVFPKCTSA